MKTLFLALLLGATTLTAHAQPRLAVGVAPYDGAAGNLTVPVTLTNDGDVRALQFDLQYPQGTVDVGAVLPGVTLSAENALYQANVNGAPVNWVHRRVVVTPTTNNALLTSGALLDISMLALSPPAVNSITLSVVNIVMSDGLAHVVASNTCAIGGFIYNPGDTATDTDTDGLTNVAEAQTYLTNPGVIDSDCDSMPDGFEVRSGLNPSLNDAYGDRDGDGLTNLAEYTRGTNPAATDSDGDGLPDGFEVNTAGLNPLDPADGAADFDGDGLTNAQEYAFGTNIALVDSNGNGISDYNEWLAAQNPFPGPATLAAGNAHALTLQANGTVWQWGAGATSTPALVGGLAGSTQVVAAGGGYSLALAQDGSVWGWGYNANGQLGTGNNVSATLPVQGAWSNITAVAVGWSSSFAIRSDGTLWAAGWNMFGQLGDGTTVDRATPVQVSGLTNVVAVASNAYHSLALTSDGRVWAWGLEMYGEHGDGGAAYSQPLTPVQVTGLTDVIAISAGNVHSLALKRDGTVWAWGDNGNGQLGDGTFVDQPVPIQVPGLAGVTALSASYASHNLAVKADGTVWTWGFNRFGQLGDGTTLLNRNTPVPVMGLANVKQVAGGYGFSVAKQADGSVWSWGRNDAGQLGDGTTLDRPTAAKVNGLP